MATGATLLLVPRYQERSTAIGVELRKFLGKVLGCGSVLIQCLLG